MKSIQRWLFLLCCAILPGLSSAGSDITVATYNLRLDLASDGLNAWPQRREFVKQLIRYHGFDLFGTQEGLIGQLRDLDALDEYARVGVGRDDGVEGGEHSAIFFRKARFTLLQKGDFWLSATPERPSRSWDSPCCHRIASWARLRDREGGGEVTVFSVHFDHVGTVARRESARLLLEKIAVLGSGSSVICLGDFNSTPETEQVRRMQAALRDARLVTRMPPYGPEGTFNDFQFTAPLKERIDYIFVSADVDVLKYAVLTDALDQRYPSDHLPVVARLRLP